jgi:glycosyltransferase involved in cell wall biosynthesis
VRVVFLTQYYPPETGAAPNRLWNLAQRLAGQGHSVSVMTALPSYPRGTIFEEYRGRIVDESMEGPVRVIRAWCYATKSKRFIPRIVNYLSFVVTSVLFAIWKIPSQDFVILESPPLFLGVSGLVISWMKRALLVMNVSDLWPESALALGMIQEGTLLRWMVRFEEYLYRRSVLISGQSSSIVDNIARRFPGKRVIFLPNGVSPESILSANRRDDARWETRRRLRLGDRFLVGYTGLHGLAQGLTTILEAAKILKEPEISFALIGDGPEKEQLISLAQELGLTNVNFCPPQPAADMPKVLAALDAAIVPLKRHPVFAGVLPSKLFETMGAGVPVIVSGEGEVSQIVQQAQGGICVEPEKPEALAEAVLRLFQSSELCRTYGNNASRYVLKNYNRVDIAAKLSSVLMDELASPEEKQARRAMAAAGTSIDD